MPDAVTPDPTTPDPARSVPQAGSLGHAATWVHTPESLGRAVIAEAMRMRAAGGGAASLDVKFTVDEIPPPATESEGIPYPEGSLFQVCVLVGEHHYCVAVHSPIHVVSH